MMFRCSLPDLWTLLPPGRRHPRYALAFWAALVISGALTDAGSGTPAGAEEANPTLSPVCRVIERSAAAYRLPVEYLSRLLWTESRFKSAATSPAGAQGIAQFMPATAVEEGLQDPRDGTASIAHASRLLVRLNRRFGNLGLAAAAYNAGPHRLDDWLQGQRYLPAETERYVSLVTGYPLERWIGVQQTLALAGTAPSCAAAIAAYQREAPRLRLASGRGLPVAISRQGELLDGQTHQPLRVADRLSLHAAIMQAVGVPPPARRERSR